MSDPALEAQVRERQRVTIENYANDPDLLAEHVGMEDNFQAGGYGERQIEELLQNAIDQLTEPGRVELRLADGALYCANEGHSFDGEGIRAVTGAFLSSKKDEKIGRFGLGFKSVLGVSNRPQILSQSISFGFNGEDSVRLFDTLPSRPQRVPTLRVPSLLDASVLGAEDPNIADMMKWASTIVKLPLDRGGDRLRKRLEEFDVRYLLFPEHLSRVDVTLDGGDSLVTRTFRRLNTDLPDVVQLEPAEGASSTWRVLSREHRVSDSVAKALPGLFHRENVKVSYALEQGKTGVGEFWAWFPLVDQTTASGIFNAPWQVNDDRTSLLPGSALNRELLEVAAELLIDAALLESTPADPAKHLDVLPARGRETRSNADRYLSERIPQLARRHELIPTSRGTMRAPSRVTAPRVAQQSNPFALPAEVVRRWADATLTDDTPHWTCYTTATRASRLMQLLTDEQDKPLCSVFLPQEWLSKAAEPRTVDAIDAALSIYLRLDETKEIGRQFVTAEIIPLEDGTLARIADAPTILLPVKGQESPSDILLVDSRFAFIESLAEKFHAIGVADVSPDQMAAAASASARSDWSDSDWERLWGILASASPAAGVAALKEVIDRRIEVMVPVKSGEWRRAHEVFRDPASVPGLPSRQVDIFGVGGRSDLLLVAGCLDDLSSDFPIQSEASFVQYRKTMQREANAFVAHEFGKEIRGSLQFVDGTGVGPLDILYELAAIEDPASQLARARWSVRVLQLLKFDETQTVLDFFGRAKPMTLNLKSPELWVVEAYGLLDTTLGPQRPGAVLAASCDRYAEMLPVSRESLSGVFSLPSTPADFPDSALKVFMEREGYQVADPEVFGEVVGLCASSEAFANVTSLPAISPKTGEVRLSALASVVLAEPDDVEDLRTHGLRYIPAGSWDKAVIAAWSIPLAIEIVARSVDWTAATEAVPLADVYPTIERVTDARLDDVWLRTCSSILRRTTTPSGSREQRLSVHLDGRTVLVDADLDPVDTLLRCSDALHLGLTWADARSVVEQDELLKKSKLVQRVQAESAESSKLLALVGRDQLAENLPLGLLELIQQRQGSQTDHEVADLFLTTSGHDALRRLKGVIAAAGLTVPRVWEGSPEAEQFVTSLGFPRAYAGQREKKAPPIELIPGKVELNALHEFQRQLAQQIRDLSLIREKDGEHRRGLLYLPTGAGKTRVTTESIAEMLREDELGCPVLWIAQSEELCEQAILSWAEVWRAVGDGRPLEVTRYWDKYEADESLQELQVVVATDAKLARMIEDPANRDAHAWLQDSKLVVIDEAHRAGSSRYVDILKWLGITLGSGAHTARPLLGLTATPYRGTNEEINRLFAARFGNRRLNALDEADPIGQLRDMRVLSRVEHQILDGIVVNDSPTDGRGGSSSWDDVSREILMKLGENLDRTQMLVDHILRQDPDWPILVFTPSVVSAHVTAALTRSLGRTADAVDGEMRGQERRRKIDAFKAGETKVLVNCDLLTQGFDAPKVRALYIARPTFSPNRYVQMVGRGLRGPENGGTEECLVVNMVDTFTQFDRDLAYTEFDHLWTRRGTRSR